MNFQLENLKKTLIENEEKSDFTYFSVEKIRPFPGGLFQKPLAWVNKPGPLQITTRYPPSSGQKCNFRNKNIHVISTNQDFKFSSAFHEGRSSTKGQTSIIKAGVLS